MVYCQRSSHAVKAQTASRLNKQALHDEYVKAGIRARLSILPDTEVPVWFQQNTITGTDEEPQPAFNAVCNVQFGAGGTTGGDVVKIIVISVEQ